MMRYCTIPEAIKRLFGVAMAQHQELRNSINTLVKALEKDALLRLRQTRIGYADDGRQRWELPDDQLTTLHNAVILHGLLGIPKQVCTLLHNPTERQQHASWLRELLVKRQSVASLGLIRPELLQLLTQLETLNLDLQNNRLANPFEVLPQMGLGDYGGNLLKALAMQTSVLSTGDSMMVHYFNRNLEAANLAAQNLQTDDPMLTHYRELILREYTSAVAFDALLDEMR